jgi:hypothetical protein
MKLIAPLPRDAHCQSALPAVSRLGARQPLIEGSWRRIEPDRPPHLEERSRSPVLLWATLAIAGLAAGGLVYAHGGLETRMIAHAAAAGEPAQPETFVAPVVEQVAAADPAAFAADTPAGPPGMKRSRPASVASVPENRPALAAPRLASEPGVVIGALATAEAAVAPLPQAAAPAALHAETPPQARLPRPRPEPRIAFASIERRWAEIRALRNPALYPLIRPRFLHRYRLPPL